MISESLAQALLAGDRAFLEACNDIYPSSIWEVADVRLAVFRDANGRQVLCAGSGLLFEALQGEDCFGIKSCPLNAENAQVIRQFLPATAPSVMRDHKISMGLGDRLGLAAPGQLRALKGKRVFPILAQQSMRELNLTGRNYRQVLDAATWSVLQSGWTGGFGADGDHLKTIADIKSALDCGYTMITLDCSEHIHNDVTDLSDAEADARYAQLPEKERETLERNYLGRSFSVPDFSFRFEPAAFRRIVLTYRDALAFMVKVWQEAIQPVHENVDYELSIDETLTPTDPAAHYFIAAELEHRGVQWESLAPRFCGEFQKGIDYIGDIALFEQEFAAHQAIAAAFSYKLSIHSGSDKFAVFPIIGQAPTYHIKTAGTNWLEAVRVIACIDPSLYREMHAYAIAHISEAQAYYHISNGPETLPPLETLTDEQLPELMDRPDARQCMHITYGVLLQAREENGGQDGDYIFRRRIYRVLIENEEAYRAGLCAHIGKHLTGLGL